MTEPKRIISSAVAVEETPAEGKMMAETPEEMLAETPEEMEDTVSGVLIAALLTSVEPKVMPGKECTVLENGGGEGRVVTCAAGKVED